MDSASPPASTQHTQAAAASQRAHARACSPPGRARRRWFAYTPAQSHAGAKEVVRGRGARGRGCTRSERAGARGALLVDDSLGT